MKLRLWAGVVVLLVAGCGANRVIDGPGPRPDPSAPATGPVVAAITSGATVFQLHDEGGGCLAVNVERPGLQRTVDRQCFTEVSPSVVSATESCGYLTEPAASAGDCDVELPRVVYGLVTNPDVAHVCLGIIPEDGPVAGARFVDQDAAGRVFTLAKPDEATRAPHLFTAAGQRYGDPPLDAPSGPIYEMCEALAPWGDAARTVEVGFRITVSDEVRRDDVVVSVDAGTGPMAVGGGAFRDTRTVDVHAQVGRDRKDVRVVIRAAGEVVLDARYDWPSEVQRILTAPDPCAGPVNINLRLTPAALEGDEAAVTLQYNGADC